jgi:hypothetical protein
MQENIIVKVGADITNMQKNLKSATGQLEGFGSKIGGIMKSIGAVAAAGTAIAGAAVLGLGKSSVFAAADMQAANAQFTQVFGDMGTEATATLKAMGEEFGMLPERLKGPLSMTTSMFKGLGMDTKTAMETAAGAVTIAADAAAFYDKSYEDANAALNSFIKGNYEGGEAIGLFANESQLAAWASKELGTDWKKLDEAGKQVTRLKFAEAMQASAGATGQASRESESLTNMQGNLQSAWKTLLAKMGEPILPMVIDWMKQLTDKVVAFDAKKAIADLKGIYERGKEVVTMAKDFVAKWSPLIAGVAAGAVTFGVITAAMKAYRLAMAAAATVQLFLNGAMVANPIGLVVVAIGLLVAAGVLLYKNWDVVKAKLGQLWSTIKTKFSDIKNSVTTKMTEVKTTISNKWNEVMSFFKGINLKQVGIDIVKGLINGIGSMGRKLTDKVKEMANLIPKWAKDILGIASPIRKSCRATKKAAIQLAKKLAEKVNEPAPKFKLNEVSFS